MGQATITAFTNAYSGSLSITNTLGGCPVTSIGYRAFYQRSKLTDIVIPPSVTTIGQGAFSYCTMLTGVTIPSSVTGLGNNAFFGCFSLTNASIPGSVTKIGDDTFVGCYGLTSFTISNGITSIGERAFYDCRFLADVTIPNSVTNLGYGAFLNCCSLQNVIIPNSVTSIGDAPFASCSNLTEIMVDVHNPAYCGVDGVLFNKGKTMLLQCPGGKVGSYAISDTVTKIGFAAFYSCTRLTNITCPESVHSIGKYSFFDCTGLTVLTFPGSITNIDDYAFYSCTGLTSVLFQGTPPTFIGSSVFSSAPATLYYLPAYASTWPATFADRPTLCWNPAIQRDAAFGFTANRFGFNIGGTPNIPVRVEATTNLASAVWVPVTNATINSSGSLSFTDPASSTLPARFYRIVFP